MNPFKVTVKNPETNKDNIVEISEYTPTDGRGKEKSKLRPSDFETWNLAKATEVFGAAKLWDVVVVPKLMQLWTNYTNDAFTKTETVNGQEKTSVETDEGVIQKSYGDRFIALSRRGESLQALSRRKNELVLEMSRIADILIFGKVSKDATGKEVTVDALPDEKLKLKNLLNTYKTERAQLEEDIAEIISKRASSNTNDEGDEEDTSAPEVKKAA